jgi:hypothetical protein
MNASASAPTRSRGLTQWSGLGGIAFLILFVAGGALAYGGQPDTSGLPAKTIAYYSDSGHRDKIGFGWLATILGVFAFLWFVSSLRQTLRSTDDGGVLTSLITIGGTIYAALALTSIALWTAVATMSDDTYRDTVYPGIIHAANDAGYVIHASGGIGMGTLMIASSLAASKGGLIPNWACVVGVIFGVLALLTIFFLPLFTTALWILVVSVLLFRVPKQQPGAAAAG